MADGRSSVEVFEVNMKRKDFAELRRKMSENSIDELIELLSSEDLQVRFLAEMCLRDATSV